MGHLPDFVLILLKTQVLVVPVAQKVLMGLYLLQATWCLLSILRRCLGELSYGQLFRKLAGSSGSVPLETVLNQQPQHEPAKGDNK